MSLWICLGSVGFLCSLFTKICLSLFINFPSFQRDKQQILKNTKKEQANPTGTILLLCWCQLFSFWASSGWWSATCWRRKATGAPQPRTARRRRRNVRRSLIQSWVEVSWFLIQCKISTLFHIWSFIHQDIRKLSDLKHLNLNSNVKKTPTQLMSLFTKRKQMQN